MVIGQRFAQVLPLQSGRGVGRMRLRTLVMIRWIAVLGQTCTLVFVYFWLGFDLPLLATAIVIGVSAALNAWSTLQRSGAVWLDDREAAFYLAYDLSQLVTLLFLTGGLGNPFSVLVLAPVTVSATVLSRTSTVVLAALTVGLVSLIALWHLPLPWHEVGYAPPTLLLIGLWAGLVFTVLFIVLYVSSISSEARQMSDALQATQMALGREQQLSALGGLAAAAAHELGSPLGTIAVVARELARDLPPDSPLAEDVALLEEESDRCREILRKLAAKPETDPSALFNRVTAVALVEKVIEPYHEGPVEVTVSAEAPKDAAQSGQPLVPRSAEIIHGLGNFVQNAVQFARSRVEILIEWDQATLSIRVEDDGPGFSPGILESLGEPYISTGRSKRREDEDHDADIVHMGLGVFIACSLLQRTGAEVTFGNRRKGGARVDIRWNRTSLEAAGPAD